MIRHNRHHDNRHWHDESHKCMISYQKCMMISRICMMIWRICMMIWRICMRVHDMYECWFYGVCIKCTVQGVGSTDVFYTRMGNYKSVITNKKRGKCGIEHHFVSLPDHSFKDFKVQIIVQLENTSINRKTAFKRVWEFEGYWQVELCTIEPQGMNSIDEFHRNRFAQDKAAFNWWFVVCYFLFSVTGIFCG